MKVFISRLHRQPEKFKKIASKVFYKMYGHISDFEPFFLDLIFTPKPNFLDCIR